MADTASGTSADTLKGTAAGAFKSVANGPVAQNVKNESAKTKAEFSTLAASRQTPTDPAATGQPLTHYHSFFSELLSWNNPRASAIAYASVVAFIFAVRYLDVLRWGFRLTWMVLAVTIAAEVAGKALLNSGFATQLRPRKYYTVPREALDGIIGDVHELLNFFVIESQRILFAENIGVSIAACVGAFLSYYLVKIMPYWGLALMATTLFFFVPLIYSTNQELIDHHVKQATDVVSAQTTQLKDVANKHTAHATEITKQYLGDYTAKAQQALGVRSASTSSASSKVAPKESDFPAAPKGDFKTDQPASANKDKEEPLIAT